MYRIPRLPSSLMHEQVVADVVIGSDGVRSKARELVLGYFDRPKVNTLQVLLD